MPRKCHCEERIKVLEENLLLLQNLLVKGNVLIEGDLIVKGKITDANGNPPNLGQNSNSCTATLAPGVFNINTLQPTCRTITQENTVIGSSRVLFGPSTNGLFTFINRSLIHTIGLFNLGTPAIVSPVYNVPTRSQVKITFTNGVITSIEEPIPI